MADNFPKEKFGVGGGEVGCCSQNVWCFKEHIKIVDDMNWVELASCKKWTGNYRSDQLIFYNIDTFTEIMSIETAKLTFSVKINLKSGGDTKSFYC